MGLKKIVVISLVVFPLLLGAGILQAEKKVHQPGKMIVNTIDKGLKILKDPSIKKEDKKERLWKQLEPIFDFKAISKMALGRHWKKHTPEERKKFTDIFTTILKNVYLNKTASYSGKKVIFKQQFVQAGRAKVQTNIITDKGKKVSVDLSMHKIDGSWKVYDMTIEGVSIVNNYRSQFNTILSKSSFKDLLGKLREKVKN